MEVKDYYRERVVGMSDRELLKELLYLVEEIKKDKEFDLGDKWETLTKHKIKFCRKVLDSRVVLN